MAMLSRVQLLSKEELKREKVVLDATTDEFIFVRAMTAHEKSIWEMSQLKKSGAGKKTEYNVTLDDYRAKLAVVCVCDGDGNLIFQPEDYIALSENISAAKLELIVNVAQKLNAITEEDREEIVKN